MTLEDTARTAREAKGRQPIDPVVEAAKQGKAPTLGDVKKSVKV
jgi:hypothetical protein